MLKLAVRRLFAGMLLVVFVSLVSFGLLYAAGDPATAIVGQGGTAQDAEHLRDALGLNRPLHEQYLQWASRALQGDLGTSLRYDQPVLGMVVQSFRITFLIGGCAMVIATLLAVGLGVLAARRPGSLLDRLVLLLSVAAQSMPTFCLALFGVIVFSVRFPILPSSGSETWRHLVMPIFVLAFFALPSILKLTRAGMIDTLAKDHVRTARAMGINEPRVLFLYALRNALLPAVGVAAAQFGFLLSGSIVVESVFAIYGAGRLALDSVLGGDIPLLQALVLSFSLIYIVLTLIADLAVAWLDPRLRS